MNRKVRVVLGLMLPVITVSACVDVTEFDMTYDSGLSVISPVDLSLVASFPDMINPRCIMLYPGTVFAASTEGTVYRFDAESYTLTGEYNVGVSSPAGYTQMVFSPVENTAYIIGSMGRLLELSIPECQVIDEFTLCSSPVEMAVTAGVLGYLWVVDGTSNTVYQVDIGTNQSHHSISFPGYCTIKCIEPSGYYQDSLLVGTSLITYKLEALSEGGIRATYVPDLFQSCVSLCSIPYDSNFVAVVGNYPYVIGELCAYDDSFYIDPPPRFYNTDQLTGDNVITAAANDYKHVYALSYLGDGVSRLSSYSYIAPYGINGYADFQGYPVDMKVSESGNIYVLTYE